MQICLYFDTCICISCHSAFLFRLIDPQCQPFVLLDVYSEVQFSFDENYSCDIGLFFYYQRAYVIPLGCTFILGLRVTSQLFTEAFQIVHLGVALNFLPILFLWCTLYVLKSL